MKLLSILLVFSCSGHLCAQSVRQYINTVEQWRKQGILTTKSSTDKTFAGSVVAYYHNDTLVLINTLTDAEAAGTETSYFIKDGILVNVMVLAASFNDNDQWSSYYSKHQSLNRCQQCHGIKDCTVTEIIFNEPDPILSVIQNKRKIPLTVEDKEKIIAIVRNTHAELLELIKTL